jgi:hypothetical protein
VPGQSVWPHTSHSRSLLTPLPAPNLARRSRSEDLQNKTLLDHMITPENTCPYVMCVNAPTWSMQNWALQNYIKPWFMLSGYPWPLLPV